MGVLLALLLASDTVLVVPFVPRGDAPPAAGIAVAEAVLDVVVQANRDNFLTLKQLDAVLRRRDLRLDDAAVAARASELARPLGASDVVSGEVWLEEGQWRIAARRTKVAEGRAVVEANEEGPRSAFPVLSHKIGIDLFGPQDPALGPLTGSAAALEQAASCWKHLARQSLGAHARITLPPDRLAAAERACKAALQADPRLGLARAGLAVTLAVRGKFALARKQARRAQARRFVPLAVLAESFAARKMQDAGWRATLESAVIARRGFLHALGYLAEDRMEQGDDEGALAIFDRYLQLSPNHPWAMGKKGRQLARVGRMDEAIETSEKALGLDPGNPELLVETASRYIDAGRDAKALPLLEQALKANPPRPTAALRLGYVYLRGDNLPLARQALEQCLRLATREDEARTRGIAHADLAIVNARQEQYGEAVTELQKARGEGNNHLPCEEPEIRRWKERPELREVCVAAEAALAAGEAEEDAVPVEL